VTVRYADFEAAIAHAISRTLSPLMTALVAAQGSRAGVTLPFFDLRGDPACKSVSPETQGITWCFVAGKIAGQNAAAEQNRE
jgi:hypothetical protein